MSKEILTYGNIEIDKNKFYTHKSSIVLGDVHIDIVDIV